jgi:ornithine cyclodeaminase/alanine dehydrogenase-like protein (mu-crystallin family)
VWARRRADAARWARPRDDLEAAVRAADVIALTTAAPEPDHPSRVGQARARTSPRSAITRRAASYHASSPSAATCSSRPARRSRRRRSAAPELAGLDPGRGTELGELLGGSQPGRRGAEELTVYKAMGHVVEDVVAAELVHRRALERGVGRVVAI